MHLTDDRLPVSRIRGDLEALGGDEANRLETLVHIPDQRSLRGGHPADRSQLYRLGLREDASMQSAETGIGVDGVACRYHRAVSSSSLSIFAMQRSSQPLGAGAIFHGCVSALELFIRA